MTDSRVTNGKMLNQRTGEGGEGVDSAAYDTVGSSDDGLESSIDVPASSAAGSVSSQKQDYSYYTVIPLRIRPDSPLHTLKRSIFYLPILPAPSYPAMDRETLQQLYDGRTRSELMRIFIRDNVRMAEPSACLFLPGRSMRYFPASPGAPGLTFTWRRRTYESLGLTHVFTEVIKSKGKLWTYLGNYILERVRPVHVEELTDGPIVRATRLFAQEVLHDKKMKYRRIRAQLYLRKTGRPSAPGDIESEAARNLDPYTQQELDKRDVADALARGELTLDVFAMRCIGYDHLFALHYTEKTRSIEPQAPKANPKQSKAIKRMTTKAEKKKEMQHLIAADQSPDDDSL